jgi:hypothetical protein
MATGGVTRAKCEAKAHAAVMRWASALGLDGAWRFKTVIAAPDVEEDLKDNRAAVEVDHARRTARVLIHERLAPEWYEHEAAHEMLHILFAPLERAIDELTEPAKTLMDDALHAAITRLACVLTEATPPDDEAEELGQRVPWEAERGG